ncbi:DUF4097 family beta strand repeat-containing protein [Lactobacillus sp. ESL0785]|uniref:DUF4097 family beta strand repeat-containing protein n=1 Tax=Lactobacillus sp. ESL0785 TaxID=2983232 RepID=UPI0023F77B96|nr:DUF4097 family beta strand repeat-containing protein [Lactobacillus sp. ESL0785]WEV70946.1 DUF4097 family beta strand repeat-containing protein [Lactobacillus sp. ESL0785]
MKNFYKIGAGGLIIGLILLIIGFSNHGLQAVTGNSLAHCHVVSNQSATSKTNPLKPFNQIDLKDANINNTNTTIYIHSGKKFQVKTTTNAAKFTTKVVNHKLTIVEKDAQQKQINFNLKKAKNTAQIEITIPTTQTLNEVNTLLNHSNVKLANINIKRLSLDQEEGNATLNNVKVSQFSFIKYAEGNVSATNSTLNNTDFEFDGPLTLTKVTLTGKNSLKANDNDIKIADSQINNINLDTNQGKLSAQNSVFASSKATFNKGNIQLTNCSVTGNNSFVITKGNFSLTPMPTKTNYSLAANNGQLTYAGHAITNAEASNFTQQTPHAKNNLIVKVATGDITLK